LLGTLSFGRPMAIVGPILDMVALSHAIVASTMYEDSRRRVNLGLQAFYYTLYGPTALPPLL
jgi:hypothetical protein